VWCSENTLDMYKGYFPKDRKAKNVIFALLTPPPAAHCPAGQWLVSHRFYHYCFMNATLERV